METEILGSGIVYGTLSAYLFGVLSSLTPCVYPLIPVTIALFGADQTSSRLRAAFLSSAYVLGMALTYTVLGLFSARTGQLFGSVANNPVVLGITGVLLVLLLLSTLDIVHLRSLQRLQTKASRVGGRGAGGALLMGAASGFVAAPCVGPALVLLLGIAAKSESMWKGGVLLFSYSLGLGTIFLILGTFSGLLQRIPRSGPWLNGVKFVIACALIVALLMLFEARIAVPPIERNVAALLLVLTSGLAAAYVGYRWRLAPARAAGAVLCGYLSWSALIAPPPSPPLVVADGRTDTPQLAWRGNIHEALA